jgi:hypothetical protein
MNRTNDFDDEEPLDPATERVRRKMMRLLAVSIGIMMVGLAAVLAAIVYRIGAADTSTIARNDAMPVADFRTEGTIDLPDDAIVRSASLAGNFMLLHVQLTEGVAQMLVYDLVSGRVVATVAIE